MIRLLLLLFTISTLYSIKLSSQSGETLEIIFEIPSFSNKCAKITYYYGNQIFLSDSLLLDEYGKGIYSGKHHEGIYILLLPDSTEFEFMVTEGRHYRIFQPDSHPADCIRITGNPATETYADYLLFQRNLQFKADSLKGIPTNSLVTKESMAIRLQLQKLQDSLDIHIRHIIQQFGGSLVSNYLKSHLKVKMPEAGLSDSIGKVDSMQWISELTYFRKHYFDNVEWSDARLVYTPVIADKVTIYLDKLTLQEPEILAVSIDEILNMQSDKNVYRFIIGYLLNKYEKKKNIGLGEFAYLHIIGNYYLTGKTPWLEKTDSFLLQREYEKLKPVSLMMQSPEISLPDQNGQLRSLYGTNSDYTLVFFWDYSCPSCKRILSDLVNVIDTYSFLDINVFTIYTGNDPDIWKAFLAKKIPSGWINTIQTGETVYCSEYNISLTPAIFLLDKNKIILKKNLTVYEVNSYLFSVSEANR